MAEQPYRPMMSAERQAVLRRWHDAASAELHHLGHHEASYLGVSLTIPEQVFPPAPMSQLLGRAVLDEVRPSDRVLDMGTGCGINAILAASRSHDVVGVDLNPHAVAAAMANAKRNGVADRTQFYLSDVFDRVDGRFDLIIFDPPFRWFPPRDWLEVAFADENYGTLTRFMIELPQRLRTDGRALLFFGTSGDMDYLDHLITKGGLSSETVASRNLNKEGIAVTYSTLRLTIR